MREGTINGTILGGHIDHQQAVFTVMDNGGELHELVISADMAVLPDEALLNWETKDID